MPEIIGVKFRTVGKVYYFAPNDIAFEVGDGAIVETARGLEYGDVVTANKEVPQSEIVGTLKPVVRKANAKDKEKHLKNEKRKAECMVKAREKIEERKLDMKLKDVEFTFDGSKIIFYFSSESRVDFRELVKDLAAVFKTRIELRQIGVRDETKILGGIGSCGRPLCCATYMPEFIPVSIKMAKEQNLSLNPSKISGVCGRLMCCLKNEQETYEELNSNLPNVGDYVTTPEKLKGEVSSVNVLRQLVKVIVTLDGDEKEIREYHVAEIRFNHKRRNDRMNIDDKELKELEELEKKEGKAHINDD